MTGPVDWARIFVPKTPLIEIDLRGTLDYLALFVLLRFLLKRRAGTLGIADLLVVVLIADAAHYAMADGYASVPEGLVLVSTIVFWCNTLDWLGHRFPALGRFFRPAPLPLVREGRILRRNLRLEFISEEELMSLLREKGVEDLSRVKHTFLKSDGWISVVQSEGRDGDDSERFGI